MIVLSRRIIFFGLTTFFLFGFKKGKTDNNTANRGNVTFQVPKGFPNPVYKFEHNKPSVAVFELGRHLFYDPILSKDSTISCASCHHQAFAFADKGQPKSKGMNNQFGERNTPALQNLVWKDAFMWDGGINNLEVQPISPITNPLEMDETLAHVLLKLKRSAVYPDLFKAAFGSAPIASQQLLRSLAQFTGMMVTANSRYDAFCKGRGGVTPLEKQGLVLFRSKCGVCHQEPLFTNNTYKSNGTGIGIVGVGADSLLIDLGRGKITGAEQDNYFFKVPSLRNVALSYPYMHDGRFATLEQVLEHYSSPANFKPGVSAEMKQIGILTISQQKAIIAFLGTLTDTMFLSDKRFSQPITGKH